jgi:hypothetical protein
MNKNLYLLTALFYAFLTSWSLYAYINGGSFIYLIIALFLCYIGYKRFNQYISFRNIKNNDNK